MTTTKAKKKIVKKVEKVDIKDWSMRKFNRYMNKIMRTK